MSTVAFSGLATGLDTASIVAQLVELRRAPVYRLQTRRTGFQDQLTALATLKEKLLAIQTAARDLDTAAEFLALGTSSSDPSVLDATAGVDAAPGTYQITVHSLALARKEASQGYDSPLDAIGAGSFTYTVGGRSETLNVAAGTTLEGLRDMINASAEGITAAIINDGSASAGYRLVVSAAETGSAGDFTLDLSALTGGNSPAMTVQQAAADAQLTIDGVAVTASSNRSDDIISGLTLELKGTGTATTLQIERDDEAMAAKVESLVTAYNELAEFADTASAAGGVLAGNSTLRLVQNRIDSLFAAPQTAGAITTFSELGVSRDRDGRLTWDPEKFTSSLADDYGAVRDFFIKADGVTGKGYLLSMAVDDMTDSVDGLFKISADALDSRIRSADRNIERYERSIDAYRETLERRFRAMEMMVARLQAQGGYLNGVL